MFNCVPAVAQSDWTTATWQGQVCPGGNKSGWDGVSCADGRVTAVDLSNLGATGRLEGFGRLTALTDLNLAGNQFAGARAWCRKSCSNGSMVQGGIGGLPRSRGTRSASRHLPTCQAATGLVSARPLKSE